MITERTSKPEAKLETDDLHVRQLDRNATRASIASSLVPLAGAGLLVAIGISLEKSGQLGQENTIHIKDVLVSLAVVTLSLLASVGTKVLAGRRWKHVAVVTRELDLKMRELDLKTRALNLELKSQLAQEIAPSQRHEDVDLKLRAGSEDDASRRDNHEPDLGGRS